jgi:hypothetical protein
MLFYHNVPLSTRRSGSRPGNAENTNSHYSPTADSVAVVPGTSPNFPAGTIIDRAGVCKYMVALRHASVNGSGGGVDLLIFHNQISISALVSRHGPVP